MIEWGCRRYQRLHTSGLGGLSMPTPHDSSYPENKEKKEKVCVYKSCPFMGNPQPSSVFCKSSHSPDGLSSWARYAEHLTVSRGG